MNLAMPRVARSLVAVALVTFSATAFAALTKTGSSTTTFTALGPGGLKIVGTTPDLSVAEAGGNVTVTVPLANLDTGISLRNSHMREKYLEVPKYPTAELTVARSALKIPASSTDANGTLKLHGVTKPVKFNYTITKDGNVDHVSGTMHIEMTDYGVTVPSYLGVTVKPGVDIAVKFDATE